MLVHQLYTDSPLRNFNYFLELNETDVIAVDPLIAEQVELWCKKNNKNLKMIIITHEHIDHIYARDALKSKTGAEVIAHKTAQGVIDNIDRYVSQGDKIPLKEGSVEILHTPGHTATHISLMVRDANDTQYGIITMDTVFNAGVGNCKQGGDPKVLFKTIKRLDNFLEDHVKLFPGHDYIEKNLKFTIQREPDNFYAKDLLEQIKRFRTDNFSTTISQERGMNVFFRLNSKEVRENLDGINESSSEEEVFLKLRELRDNF